MSSVKSAKIDLLVAQVTELKNQVAQLNTVISESFAEKVLTVADLAERYGVKKNYLYSKLWLMPNFGVSDFKLGSKRWKLSTVLDWEKKSDLEHEADWNALTVKERLAIKGVA